MIETFNEYLILTLFRLKIPSVFLKNKTKRKEKIYKKNKLKMVKKKLDK